MKLKLIKVVVLTVLQYNFTNKFTLKHEKNKEQLTTAGLTLQ